MCILRLGSGGFAVGAFWHQAGSANGPFVLLDDLPSMWRQSLLIEHNALLVEYRDLHTEHNDVLNQNNSLLLWQQQRLRRDVEIKELWLDALKKSRKPSSQPSLNL